MYKRQLVLSSVQSNKEVALASEKFLFSVIDKGVAEKFKSLQGYVVVVHYHEKNGTLPWRAETKYIVDSVTSQR